MSADFMSTNHQETDSLIATTQSRMGVDVNRLKMFESGTVSAPTSSAGELLRIAEGLCADADLADGFESIRDRLAATIPPEIWIEGGGAHFATLHSGEKVSGTPGRLNVSLAYIPPDADRSKLVHRHKGQEITRTFLGATGKLSPEGLTLLRKSTTVSDGAGSIDIFVPPEVVTAVRDSRKLDDSRGLADAEKGWLGAYVAQFGITARLDQEGKREVRLMLNRFRHHFAGTGVPIEWTDEMEEQFGIEE